MVVCCIYVHENCKFNIFFTSVCVKATCMITFNSSTCVSLPSVVIGLQVHKVDRVLCTDIIHSCRFRYRR